MISITFYNDSNYGGVKQVLKESGLYDDVWEKPERLNGKIKRDPQSIILAMDGEVVVGCVFIVEDGWTGFIWRLAVREQYRKQGVGLMLMQKAEEIIKSRGVEEASIFVDVKKESLQEWYTKQGYVATSDYMFMYKKLGDDII